MSFPALAAAGGAFFFIFYYYYFFFLCHRPSIGARFCLLFDVFSCFFLETPCLFFVFVFCSRVRTTNPPQGPMYEFFPGSGEHDDLNSNIINAPLAPLWKSKDAAGHHSSSGHRGGGGGGVHGTRSRTSSKAKQEHHHSGGDLDPLSARAGRTFYREVRSCAACEPHLVDAHQMCFFVVVFMHSEYRHSCTTDGLSPCSLQVCLMHLVSVLTADVWL